MFVLALVLAVARPANAQSFRVQCPPSTITHPNAANNNSEPAYNGQTEFPTTANGYVVPSSTTVNGAIKCQQISGGDGLATNGRRHADVHTWLTPNNNAVLLAHTVYTLTVKLKSDGDVAVDISNVTVSALNGAAKLKNTDCEGAIDVGKTCSVTLTYDATTLTGTNGRASDTRRIDLTSDAGEAHDFIQNFTILLSDDN